MFSLVNNLAVLATLLATAHACESVDTKCEWSKSPLCIAEIPVKINGLYIPGSDVRASSPGGCAGLCSSGKAPCCQWVSLKSDDGQVGICCGGYGKVKADDQSGKSWSSLEIYVNGASYSGSEGIYYSTASPRSKSYAL